MRVVRIVSKEGTAIGTQVFDAEGKEIKNLNMIKIAPIVPGELIRAELTVAGKLDIEAHAILSLESVAAAAAIHGYALVKVSSAG